MSAAPPPDTTYVIPVARVRESIDHLLSRDTHPFFIAYLYLRSLAGKQGRNTGLAPSWPELGGKLEVSEAPIPGKPYLRPFWKGNRQAGQEWLNENLAGSFAPSSLRGIPMKVVETGAKGRFNLRDDHWHLAFTHLLFDQPISGVAIAAFLFRDYGILSATPLGPADLIALFRLEYGYSAEDDAEFDLLFDVEWTGADGSWTAPLERDGS